MKLRLFALGLLAAIALDTRADFNDGVVALMTGNYEKALSQFVPLAETADHAYAQYFIGRMYADGQGVEKNSETAAKWYRKASVKGVADAQLRLAGQYQIGDGVPRDMEAAYAWYSVAATLGNAKAKVAMEESSKLLSAEELKEAQAFSAELIENYAKAPAQTSQSQ
ncbi:MAG: tetratricopeptide repeat protein [Proteobacteria bacterium]|nr:tetratricopeptide repeat protein [Pseudomonadota bacterium]